MIRTLLTLAALVILAVTVAADPPSTPADRRVEGAAYNLGVLGARGKLVADGPGRAIELAELDKGGSLDRAGLAVGDRVVMVDGAALPADQDPFYFVAAALEKRLRVKAEQRLPLVAMRGLEKLVFNASVMGLGPDWAGAMRRASAEMLATKLLTKDGCYETTYNSNDSKVAVASMAGLAMIAMGGSAKGEYSAGLRAIRGYVVEKAGVEDMKPGAPGANTNQVNWSLGFGTLFLAEWIAGREDKGALRRLGELCAAIEANQEANGGWAHGPGGPNRLGYTDFAAVTALVLAGYGAAGQVKAPVKAAVVERGIAYLAGTAGTGGAIGYSQRDGQKGMEEPGRAGAALVAFALNRQGKHALVPAIGTFLGDHLAGLPEGHASPMFHIAFGALGASTAGRYPAFAKLYAYELLLARNADGTFFPRPSPESASGANSDPPMGKAWPTAAYLLAWSLERSGLNLAGRK